MRSKRHIRFLLTAFAFAGAGCASGELQSTLDGSTRGDGYRRDSKKSDLSLGDGVIHGLCQKVGETRCDPTKTKLQTCMSGELGENRWGSPTPCQGGQCENGKCVDPCNTVTCTSPPNSCYHQEGQCWNGECKYDLKDNGDPCTDQDPCTVDDQCTAGLCGGKAMVCNLPPRNTCKDSNTLIVYTNPGNCKGGACEYGSADVPCSFGCNSDTGTCNGDPCATVTCQNPPNTCYKAEGICSGGQCTYIYDDNKVCVDGNDCTVNDKCTGGKCAGTAMLCNTPPDNTCKDATTLISNSKQGTCSAGKCNYTSTEVVCPHGCDNINHECAGDPCQGVKCNNPPNTCYKTEGTCSAGQCSYEYNDGITCNDSNSCTTTDKCISGECKGTPVVCNSPPDNTCKNTSTLTVYATPGVCSGGDCEYSSAEVPCSNGCEQGVCKGDPCAGVTCDNPPNAQCYTVPGFCSNGQCNYLPKTGTGCNDNKPCTKNDVCDANGTCAGTGYSCDDILVCTIDACDGSGGCTHNLDAGSCLMWLSGKNTCVQGGALSSSNACEHCDPSFSTEIWKVATGTPVQQWAFTDGSLQGFTVTPNPATSPVKWQVDNKRSFSPAYSLYFGDVSKHTYDDPGKAVSGEVTSPAVALPTGQGKLCVEFQLFKDTENYTGTIDQLTLTAVPASPDAPTMIWQSGKEPNTAETYSNFVAYAADITSFAGKTIQLKFAFDSYDSSYNGFEGVYLDNIRINTNCNP